MRAGLLYSGTGMTTFFYSDNELYTYSIDVFRLGHFMS